MSVVCTFAFIRVCHHKALPTLTEVAAHCVDADGGVRRARVVLGTLVHVRLAPGPVEPALAVTRVGAHAGHVVLTRWVADGCKEGTDNSKWPPH